MRPRCRLNRQDAYAVVFQVSWALRGARLGKQADEFLDRAKICSSYSDMVRLASEYVELSCAVSPAANLADHERTYTFLFDPSDWKILNANQTAAERLGYSVETLTHLNIGDLAYPPMAPNGSCSLAGRGRNRAILRELRNTGRVMFESAHRRSDGTRVPVEVTLSVAEYRGRRAVVATMRDISERKRLLEGLVQEREVLSRAAEAAGVGVAMQNGNGIICYVSAALTELMGYDTHDFLGRHVTTLVDLDARRALRQHLVKRRYGIADPPYEITYLTRSRQQLPVITSPTPLFDRDGEFLGSLGTFVPASNRKQHAQELQDVLERGAELLERAGPLHNA